MLGDAHSLGAQRVAGRGRSAWQAGGAACARQEAAQHAPLVAD